MVVWYSLRRRLRDTLPQNFQGIDFIWCALAMWACGTHPLVIVPAGIFIFMLTWETYLLCQLYKHDHAHMTKVTKHPRVLCTCLYCLP